MRKDGTTRFYEPGKATALDDVFEVTDEMAEAVGRDRNFIDSTWSSYGEPVKGKQTRVKRDEVSSDDTRRTDAVVTLKSAADTLRRASDAVDKARDARNALVASFYGSKTLRPRDIAREAGIDRNHVGRLVSRAGIESVWRKPGTSKNQHSK